MEHLPKISVHRQGRGRQEHSCQGRVALVGILQIRVHFRSHSRRGRHLPGQVIVLATVVELLKI